MAHNIHSNTHSPEITFHPHHDDEQSFRARVRKTTILLSIITIIELGIGLLIYTLHKGAEPNPFLVLAFKGVVCILTLAKAFYIVSVFMHLGDEIRNMIMTIVMPLMLFVWFITAFLWDGNSFRTLRNRYDKRYQETTLQHEVRSTDTSGHGGLQ
ncbi:MAG: hypothetical protein EOP50_07635 [Sphingobacteriales bacterium]|nr:MAG: hypothetical protein EOP50_07635 [Sphingobacteriales bacterium]